MAVDQSAVPEKPWPVVWMSAFLAALRNSANVRASCQAAGISRKEAYRQRNTRPRFREAWDEAVEDALDVLEAVAFQRARESSDYLLWKILAARRREMYSDALRIDIDVKQAAGKLAAATGADPEFLIRRAQQLAEENAAGTGS